MTRTLPPQEVRTPRPGVSRDLPFISVIVPVRNEARFIRRTLGQLLEQDYDPRRYEILVADGCSEDETPSLVRELMADHENLRLIDNPARWSSAGRNRAVRAARGDVVVLVDGHCELGSRHYLREVADAFLRSGADCLGRPQPLDVPGATTLQRAIAAARSSWLGHNPASYIYSSVERLVPAESVAVAYRRDVFNAVGLFDESFDACEDVEFNYRLDRAGYRCFFTPRVGVRYHPRGDLRGLFSQLVRYGRGRMRLLRKHPETFSVSCLLPAVLLVGVAVGVALAPLSPWLAVPYAAALGVYLATVLLVSLFLSARARDVSLLPWLPFAFVAIHAGAGTGLLLEATGVRRTRTASQTLEVEVPRERRRAA